MCHTCVWVCACIAKRSNISKDLLYLKIMMHMKIMMHIPCVCVEKLQVAMKDTLLYTHATTHIQKGRYADTNCCHFVGAYIYIYIHMCVYVYTYINTCMYTHIHTYT
jgi:hypothetical protein